MYLLTLNSFILKLVSGKKTQKDKKIRLYLYTMSCKDRLGFPPKVLSASFWHRTDELLVTMVSWTRDKRLSGSGKTSRHLVEILKWYKNQSKLHFLYFLKFFLDNQDLNVFQLVKTILIALLSKVFLSHDCLHGRIRTCKISK